jgi:hypothetical protein
MPRAAKGVPRGIETFLIYFQGAPPPLRLDGTLLFYIIPDPPALAHINIIAVSNRLHTDKIDGGKNALI